MIRFFISVIILSVVMLAGARWADPVPSWDIAIVAFLATITSLIFIWLYPKRTDSEKFTQLYLLSIVLKIIAASAFVIAFLLTDEGAFANTIFFLIAYLHFTGLEVIFLLTKSKAKKIS